MSAELLDEMNVALRSVLQRHQRYLCAKLEGNDDNIRGASHDLNNACSIYNQLVANADDTTRSAHKLSIVTEKQSA